MEQLSIKREYEKTTRFILLICDFFKGLKNGVPTFLSDFTFEESIDPNVQAFMDSTAYRVGFAKFDSTHKALKLVSPW